MLLCIYVKFQSLIGCNKHGSKRNLSCAEEDIARLADIFTSLPLIGALFEVGLDTMTESIISADAMSDRILSRIVDGSAPCEISFTHGVRCIGIAKKGPIQGMIKSGIDIIPDQMLPKFAKMLLLNSIMLTVNPIIERLNNAEKSPLQIGDRNHVRKLIS